MSALAATNHSHIERRGVLLDIDGTLCDTNYIHAVTWGKAIREATGRNIPMTTLHHHIGMGSDKFTEAVLGENNDHATELHSKMYKDYWLDVVAFDRVPEFLHELKDRGLDVIFASSAGAEEFEMLQDVIGAKDAITAVTSSGDVKESKPAPDIFGVALERGGLEPTAAIAIGDTVYDIKAANAAGVECIGVLTGGIARSELMAEGAIEVYESISDLLDNLDDSALGRLWNVE